MALGDDRVHVRDRRRDDDVEGVRTRPLAISIGVELVPDRVRGRLHRREGADAYGVVIDLDHLLRELELAHRDLREARHLNEVPYLVAALRVAVWGEVRNEGRDPVDDVLGAIIPVLLLAAEGLVLGRGIEDASEIHT